MRGILFHRTNLHVSRRCVSREHLTQRRNAARFAVDEIQLPECSIRHRLSLSFNHALA